MRRRRLRSLRTAARRSRTRGSIDRFGNATASNAPLESSSLPMTMAGASGKPAAPSARPSRSAAATSRGSRRSAGAMASSRYIVSGSSGAEMTMVARAGAGAEADVGAGAGAGVGGRGALTGVSAELNAWASSSSTASGTCSSGDVGSLTTTPLQVGERHRPYVADRQSPPVAPHCATRNRYRPPHAHERSR